LLLISYKLLLISKSNIMYFYIYLYESTYNYYVYLYFNKSLILIKLTNAYIILRKNYYLYCVYKKYSVFCEFFYKLNYLSPHFEVLPREQYLVAMTLSTYYRCVCRRRSRRRRVICHVLLIQNKNVSRNNLMMYIICIGKTRGAQ
jgi:hypothetical protein